MSLDDHTRSVLDTMIVQNALGKLMGFILDEAHVDRVGIRLPYREEITTMGDLIHGGSIGALVDAAATACAWSGADLNANPRGTTISYTVNFLEAARGQDIIATARTLRRGGSVVVIEVEVHGADDILVAQALVTYKLSAAR